MDETLYIRCGTCTTEDEVETCTYENVTWKLFYADCPETNILCRGTITASAYLPAITVCNQRLS